MFKKTIIWEFFTTVSFSQSLDSLYLMTFWSYKLKNGEYNWKLIDLFWKKILKNNDKYEAFTLYNWRSAIYHALEMIWIEKEDEIIISSYNCSVVVNAVIQTWWQVKYADIEKETLWLYYNDILKKITANTKVIIIQHTFWKQARDYKKIINIAKQKNIVVIEDCTHSLWNNWENKGDFLIYSTWRDKVISSVTWWILIINNKKYFWKEIKQNQLSIKLIYQNLMYNIVWYKSYKLYDFFKLWRIVIYLSRKLHLITEILNKKEKNFNDNSFKLTLPNSLAYLAYKELLNLDKYTKIRLENARYYLENIKNKNIDFVFTNLENYNWFRFPILLKSEEEKIKLYNLARKNKILLWNQWSGQNIIPIWINLEKTWYKIWSCSVAEDISKRVLTLPNHKLITKKDLDRVIEVLNNF